MSYLKRWGCTLLIVLHATWSIVTAQTVPNEDSGGAKWKMWGGAAIDMGLSKKMEFSLSYLRAYNVGETMQANFNQGTAAFSYDISKHLDAKAGITVSQFPASDKLTHRYYLRGSYSVSLGDRIRWTNGIQGERHSANENRFDYRFIYITRLALRKRLEFLRLAPSISYWLYYNVGGSRIQYYDELGQPSVKESSAGIHRGRWIVNLNSKLNDWLSISAYYLRQDEFNLFDGDRGINVLNPATGKITRPFSNYNVIGMSLKFHLEL